VIHKLIDGRGRIRLYTDRELKHAGLMRRSDGLYVCDTCGGNCGQCGYTGLVANVPASMGAIAACHETGEKIGGSRWRRAFDRIMGRRGN
jgi:hypothetical protein